MKHNLTARTERQIRAEVFVPNVQFRQRLGELVSRVADKNKAIVAGSNPDNPTYRLCPLSDFTQEQIARALPLGIDQARKDFSNVRWAARADGIAFGLQLEGQVAAIFMRHPNYRPGNFEHYRQEARRRGVLAVLPTLEERLQRIEQLLLASASKPRGRPKKVIPTVIIDKNEVAQND